MINQNFDPEMTPEEIYEETIKGYEEEFNFTWLDPLGFNNTFTLAMRAELYDELARNTRCEF